MEESIKWVSKMFLPITKKDLINKDAHLNPTDTFTILEPSWSQDKLAAGRVLVTRIK